MKRFLIAILVCGMGLVSYAQLLETSSRLVVLKGTVTDTVHYVLSDTVPDTVVLAAQRDALGVGAIGLSARPRVYYFLVVYLEYTPQIVSGRWTGEGDLWTWTMGAVEYGLGRHSTNGMWRSTAALGGAYAYDIGWAIDFGGYYWWQPKVSKKRTGDGSIYSTDSNDPALRTFMDTRDGVAELTYTAVLKTAGGKSYYEPTISNLTISYTQWMQQKFTGDVWKDAQFGAGKVVFVPETAMTTRANMTNATTGENTGLALVAADIRAYLLKNKYTTTDTAFTPNLDPSGLYDSP